MSPEVLNKPKIIEDCAANPQMKLDAEKWYCRLDGQCPLVSKHHAQPPNHSPTRYNG